MSHEIINGDCIEELKNIPDNSIRAVITDPPYNINMAGWDSFKTNKDFQEWIEQWGRECYRVLKPGGMIACFASARLYHYTAMALDNAGFKCRNLIEWCYWSGMPKGRNLKACHEPIYLGLKGEVKDMVLNLDACRIPVKEKNGKLIIEGKKTIEIPVENGLFGYD